MTSIADQHESEASFHDAKLSGVALQRVASRPGLLERSIVAIEAGGVADRGDLDLPRELLLELREATGNLPWPAVARHLRSQLLEVAAFARSDGGAVRENIGAVERLIRSGRVDLFC